MTKNDQTHNSLAAEVESLRSYDLNSLRAAWRTRWGEPPAYRSRELLARALAYRLQSEHSLYLPASAKRRIDELGQRFMADRQFSPPAATSLLPGTSLVREWRGQRHEVAVLTDGFLYGGHTFSSLSKVAQHITGTKWNGRAFFGLKQRGGKA